MSDEPRPLFRVVRGTPAPEELAALVGVFAARRPAAPPRPRDSSFWATRSRPGAISPAGLPVRCGASAWRASGLPR
ncbi:acyl-CoA carboxylase subunit epsilon [Rhizomonospora bruguierae]|uniref:acyl-CoA carboxylase subunit epsilon n=1 Tax=Rhizomonospora bruguierae TaxID=1581705 RepID=UPI001BCAEBE4|nr:acyl-CoA carboxylase subunit epsilon [Micromonospora sp. NBRC 107566]